MSAEDNLGKQFKKRHKMVKFTTNGGTNLACEHCDAPVQHPTRKVLGNPESMWHYTDKTGMKEAWKAHKEANP
jgi:MoaA/NifB/PqqE/SkfB family radical SAM enzyme